MCKGWAKYVGNEEEKDPGLKDDVSLSVQSVKRCGHQPLKTCVSRLTVHCRVNLPDDIFEPGERKVTKKTTKKRAATEVYIYARGGFAQRCQAVQRCRSPTLL